MKRATGSTRERLASVEIEVNRLTDDREGVDALRKARGIFVGGGNTFRLLARLQRSGFLEPLRDKVRSGTPYLGSSAGTVIAAPTLKTTNDMPILQPSSFSALGLVPFQINPHYLDADPSSLHMGETRELRLQEFLEENEGPVLGLREGAMLVVREGSVRLEGSAKARLFRRGSGPVEFTPPCILEELSAMMSAPGSHR